MGIEDIRTEKILGNMKKLSDTAAAAMGPFKRACLLDKGFNVFSQTTDGCKIAKVINLEDKGCDLIKEAAIKTHERVGDGCSASLVMSYNIVREAYKCIAAGASRVRLKNGLKKALKVCENFLDENSLPANDPDTLRKVAVTASSDEELIRNFSWVFEEVCKGKSVIIEETSAFETVGEFQSGMIIDNGYSSPYFAVNKKSFDIELEDVYILLTEKVISDFSDLIPVITFVKESGGALLILSAGIEGPALSNLLFNVHKNELNAAAVVAGGYGIKGSEVLEDAAIYTGGRVVSSYEWETKPDLRLCLGKAGLVRVWQNETRILGGAGSADNVKEHISALKQLCDNETNKSHRLGLRTRMSRLNDERIIIKVGARSSGECEELKSKLKKAFSSVQAAYRSGVCPGGGAAYVRCAKELRKLSEKEDFDEGLGMRILAKALKAPAYAIYKNSGFSAEKIISDIEDKNFWEGFDAVTGDVCHMYQKGILDAAEVLKESLRNAVSVASVFILAETIVSQNRNKDLEKN